jgi:hypothetical protein
MSPSPTSELVRRVIRSKSTNLYLTRDGHWVKEPQAAENFDSYRAAKARCWQFQLVNVELVLQFEDASKETAMDMVVKF